MTRLTTLDFNSYKEALSKDFNKLTPYAVGFDRIIDDMFRYANSPGGPGNTGYPPYNIIQNDNEFQIEIALAGVKQEDLDINVAEGVLNVSHNPPEIDEEKQNFPGSYVHRGIAQRKFSRNFTLSDDVVVQDAKFENGMLYISLERIIPEEKKPRKITITSK
jgi:molecular chaperone IbpA